MRVQDRVPSCSACSLYLKAWIWSGKSYPQWKPINPSIRKITSFEMSIIFIIKSARVIYKNGKNLPSHKQPRETMFEETKSQECAWWKVVFSPRVFQTLSLGTNQRCLSSQSASAWSFHCTVKWLPFFLSNKIGLQEKRKARYRKSLPCVAILVEVNETSEQTRDTWWKQTLVLPKQLLCYNSEEKGIPNTSVTSLRGRCPQCKYYSYEGKGILTVGIQAIRQSHTTQPTSHKKFIGENTRG